MSDRPEPADCADPFDPPTTICVTPQPQYLPDHSDAEEPRYAFAYTITIENQGEMPAKLLSRHWIITDAAGRVQEVRGDGVVGEQPRLVPGETYRYTSGCILPTPVGTMQGTYRMRTDDGREFDADIPEFALVVPSALH